MNRLIIIILPLLFLQSCTNILEENPETFIAPNSFYKNTDEITAALYGAYDILPGMYRNPYMTAFADVSSNSYKVTSASATDFQPFDTHNISPSNSLLTDFWQFSYRGINRVNAIVDRSSAIEGDEGIKNNLIGEAKFLRALYYFNMVRLFGDIPLITNETVSLDELKIPRSPSNEVYNQIIADLEDAKSKLSPLPVESGRASQNAARGLLARVYLTLSEFPKAASNAKEIIDSEEYSLWETYREAFLEINDNGKESIFSVQFTQNLDGNNLNGFALSPLLNNYVEGSPLFDLMEVTDELANSYEDGDQRKDLNAVSSYVTSSNETIIFQALSFKYSDGIFTDKDGGAYNNAYNSDVNYPILRFADVLLMYAEAENEVSGPTVDAYNSINKVRRRAFGVNIEESSIYDLSGLDKSSFRLAVWLERFKEFPHEGQQFFDLKRTNRAEELLGISSDLTLYPIPQREIDINDLLTQNPGY